MALARNRLIPLLAVAGLGIVAVILFKHFGSDDGPVKAGTPMAAPPVATAASAPAKKGSAAAAPAAARSADADSPEETLRTIAQRMTATLDDNKLMKAQIETMRDDQRALRDELLAEVKGAAAVHKDAKDSKRAGGAPGAANTASEPNPLYDLPPSQGDQAGTTGVIDRATRAMNQSVDNVGQVLGSLQGPQALRDKAAKATKGGQPTPQDIPPGLGFEGAGGMAGQAGLPGASTAARYKVVAPLGYAPDPKDPNAKPLVRTALGSETTGPVRPSRPGRGPAGRLEAAPSDGTPDMEVNAAGGGDRGARGQADASDTPYFTVPENATLTRVTAMTALIGRVPVDGKVTDPMQFKAIIGRENLAANGLDVPDDVSGIVVSGIAVGDMALSCNEGKIHSVTFVFNDGTIKTISQRKRAAAGGAQERPIGYISDLWGNPCVAGKFVTNAPAYLTDVVGMRSLGIAAAAYAAAQTSTSDNGLTGNTTTSVTGSRGAYVLGQAAAGATDQVSQWLLQRLKNSFDAVVTPAGQKLVIHIDQELAIDRPREGRKLDHQRTARAGRVATSAGDHHGLD
jgi:integrating conjugative element protein (TIGR03752 family)